MEKKIYLNAVIFLALVSFAIAAGAAISGLNLVSPADDAWSADSTPDFTFNAASSINLTDISCILYIGGVENGTNSSVFNATDTTITSSALAEGDYQWYINCTDAEGTTQGAERTITIGDTAASSTLSSPSAGYNTSSTNISFNCTSSDNNGLANVTLYGNWSAWHANETTDISGTSNTSNFSNKTIEEGMYAWNCYSCDSDDNCSFASSNRTVLIDTHNPVVSARTPADEAEDGEGSVSFVFNVSDNSSIKNCSLYIDDEMDTTDTSISKDTNQTISISLTQGDYEWYVKCYDYSGNSGRSGDRDLSITEEDDDDDDGGGSSGGSSSEDEDTVTGSAATFKAGDLSTIKTKSIANAMKDDKIEFVLMNENHTITIGAVSSNSTTFEIRSNPITATIGVGETKSFDLNGNGQNDFSIELTSIRSSKANFVLESIADNATKNASLNFSNNSDFNNTIANSTANSSSGKKWNIDFKIDWKKHWKIIVSIAGGIIIIVAIMIIVAKVKRGKQHYWKKSRTSWHKNQRFK